MKNNQKNIDELKARLLKIFKEKFNLEEPDALIADIKSVEAWDSFSHMDLMIELQSEFHLTLISGQDFAELTNFKKIYDYISRNRL